MSLSPEQVSRYREQGFLTLPGWFDEGDLEPLDQYVARHMDRAWSHKNDDPFRESHYHSRPVYDFCTSTRLLDAVEALLGPDLVLLYSHFMVKPPGGLRVAWHQDGPYWWRVEPKTAVTAWVALDDAGPENGCMRVIPGSHRAGDLGQRPTDTPDLIQERPFELPPGSFDPASAVDLVLRRRDLSLHDSYLVHGSEPNRSGRRRGALTIRYVPASSSVRDTPDRRQFLVRGEDRHTGTVYYRFGDLPAGHWTLRR